MVKGIGKSDWKKIVIQSWNSSCIVTEDSGEMMIGIIVIRNTSTTAANIEATYHSIAFPTS